MQNHFSHFIGPQGTQKSTTWVRSLDKSDIMIQWTLNECLYFLLLSPTTQKEVGGFARGDTEGSLRLLVIARITLLLLANQQKNLDVGSMPYRLPRKLGQVYGQYETIQRASLAHLFNLMTDTTSKYIQRDETQNRHPISITTETSSINNAIDKHTQQQIIINTAMISDDDDHGDVF